MSEDEKEADDEIVITVEEVQGKCPIYHEGDSINIQNFCLHSSESQDVCVHAFSAMSTFLTAFINGVSAKKLGLGKEENTAYIQCPDPGPPCTQGGTVLFKLERKAS